MNNKFTTSDLGLATALTTCAFTISDLERSNRGKVSFIFNKDNDLDNAVQKYWSNSLQVDAQTYSLTMKSLKNRIYGMN